MKKMGKLKLWRGDCLKILPKLAPGSVDLVLVDPPYGTVKSIGTTNVKHGMVGKVSWDTTIPTKQLLAELSRVLRWRGRACIFAQQPYTTELINASTTEFNHTYNMVWIKDHFANALTAKTSPLNYYEDVVVFQKMYDVEKLNPARQYFKLILEEVTVDRKKLLAMFGNAVDNCFRVDSNQFGLCTEETYKALTDKFKLHKKHWYKTYKQLRKDLASAESTYNLPKDAKHRSNVLVHKKDYGGFHPTQKPVALLEEIIEMFTTKGMIVLDNTMGSGSTGVACVNTGRKFVGIEKDDGYFQTAITRIREARKSKATAVEVTGKAKKTKAKPEKKSKTKKKATKEKRK